MLTTTQTIVRRGVHTVELLDVRLKARGAWGELEHTLRLGETVLGTDAQCDVVIDDPAISRRHCLLLLDEQGIHLRDLGSKNGTRIGDVRVAEAWLEPSQQVKLGDSRVWLELGDKPTELTLAPTDGFGHVRGRSIAMRSLFAVLERAVERDTTVLLLGETGTGKDTIAQSLHERGPRREGPYVVCDCTALNSSLIEAELFGHAEGAFSGAVGAREGLFQAASGGTLFIDEIGELPLDLQPKLLRALETRKVRPIGDTREIDIDVRVIAATHRDLRKAVAERTFREDLYYRLAIIEVRVPPLRERADDIPTLVGLFLGQFEPPLKLSDLPRYALPLLCAYSWPGNVRELRNAVERLVVTNKLEGLDAPVETMRPWPQARAEALSRFEIDYLRRALLASRGSLAGAARVLGVSRQMVHKMVLRHGLEPQSE